MSVYKLFVPKQAVGANLVYFDLFNASGSPWLVDVHAIIPIVSGEAAVVGTLGVDLFLTRTSAVGTGGTAATAEGSSLTACTFSSLNGSGNFDLANVSARLTPTGGATAAAVLGWRCVFTEETNSGAYNQVTDMARAWYDAIPALQVRPNTGLRIVQGSVASVGNIGFEVFLSLRQKS